MIHKPEPWLSYDPNDAGTTLTSAGPAVPNATLTELYTANTEPTDSGTLELSGGEVNERLQATLGNSQ